MKTHIPTLRYFALSVIGLMSLVANAVPVDGIVTLGAQGWRDQAPPVLSVTSEGVLNIELLLPTTMDRASVAVALWQISGGLSLPLREARPLEELLAGGAPDAQGVITVPVTFPKLDRKTLVLVVFTTKDDSRAKLGTVRVLVYPPFDWAALAARLKKDGPRLAVFGKEAALREFFRLRDIEFADLGDDLPERFDNDTLAVGAAPPKHWAERKDRLVPDGSRLIVFVADPATLPGVYTTATGTGTITKVTLPLLAGLSRDPRSEELLFQLIEQHLQPAPGATP